MSDTDSPLICHFVAYESSAELDVNEHGEVENHDELVTSGQTYDEVRALSDNQQNRALIADHQILTEGDSMWRDEYADMEVGDAVRLDE